MQIENIGLNEIIPYEKNPRKNDQAVDIVATSIKEYGVKQPIVVDKNNIIVVGHTRWKAMQKLGYEKAPVIRAEDLTEAQIKGYRLMDNKSNEQAEWDDELLNQELTELKDLDFDVSLAGFEDAFNEEEGEAEEDDFDTEQAEKEPKYTVQKGETWQLGNHRLMCGDATKKEDVDKLMNGQKADMVFTDPPYGIGYEYNSYEDVKGQEYLEFCDKWFQKINDIPLIVISVGWKYLSYWWMKKPRDVIYWLSRNKHTGGTFFYFRRVEPVLIWGEVKNKLNEDIVESMTDREIGLRDLHTCPKPIKYCIKILETINKRDIVLDLFGGSGSTLIACEQTNRNCYMMELDPKYCSVIIERWETYTGQTAKKL